MINIKLTIVLKKIKKLVGFARKYDILRVFLKYYIIYIQVGYRLGEG